MLSANQHISAEPQQQERRPRRGAAGRLCFCSLRPSLNFVAVVVATALLVLSAAVVVAVTSYFSTGAAESFARQLTRASTTAAQEQVDAYVMRAVSVDRSLSFGFESGAFPPLIFNQSRASGAMGYLRALGAMLAAPNYTLTCIGAGMVDGFFAYCNVEDIQQRRFTCEMTDPYRRVWQNTAGNSTWHSLQTIVRFEGGRIVGTELDRPSLYDPRLRPWYTLVTAGLPNRTISAALLSATAAAAASAVGGLVVLPDNATTVLTYEAAQATASTPSAVKFTDVYLHFFDDQPLVAADGPIVDPATGLLLGVTNTCIDLDDFSGQLAAAPGVQGTVLALLDNTGHVLGLSPRAPLYEVFAANTSLSPVADPALLMPPEIAARFATCGRARSGRIVCRHNTRTIENSVLRALRSDAPAVLDVPFESIGTTDNIRRMPLRVGSEEAHYYVSAVRATTATFEGMRWRLVCLVPEAALLEHITAGRNLAIVLSAVMVIVSSIVCGAALWWLLRPLRDLAEHIRRAAAFRGLNNSDDGDAMGTAATPTANDDLHTPPHSPAHAVDEDAGGRFPRQRGQNNNGNDTIILSHFSEIVAIQRAFTALRAQLVRARSFLPAALLAQLEVENREAERSNRGRRGKRAAEQSAESGDDAGLGSGGSDYYSDADPADAIHATPQRLHSDDEGSLGSLSVSTGTGTARSHHDTGTASYYSNGSAPHHAGGKGPVLVVVPGPLHTAATTIDVLAALGVRRRHVTVLAYNVRGYHGLTQANPTAALGPLYAALVDGATAIAKQRRGLLDSFHGDRLVFTFNAAVACGSHASAAMHTACAMATLPLLHLQQLQRREQELQQRRAKKDKELHPPAPHVHTQGTGGHAGSVGGSGSWPPATMGIATGAALVGTVGSSRACRFATIGAVFSQATAVERLAKLATQPTPAQAPQDVGDLPAVILASAAAVADTAHACPQPSWRVLPLDVVTLPRAEAPTDEHHRRGSNSTPFHKGGDTRSLSTHHLHRPQQPQRVLSARGLPSSGHTQHNNAQCSTSASVSHHLRTGAGRSPSLSLLWSVQPLRFDDDGHHSSVTGSDGGGGLFGAGGPQLAVHAPGLGRWLFAVKDKKADHPRPDTADVVESENGDGGGGGSEGSLCVDSTDSDNNHCHSEDTTSAYNSSRRMSSSTKDSAAPPTHPTPIRSRIQSRVLLEEQRRAAAAGPLHAQHGAQSPPLPVIIKSDEWMYELQQQEQHLQQYEQQGQGQGIVSPTSGGIGTVVTAPSLPAPPPEVLYMPFLTAAASAAVRCGRASSGGGSACTDGSSADTVLAVADLLALAASPFSPSSGSSSSSGGAVASTAWLYAAAGVAAATAPESPHREDDGGGDGGSQQPEPPRKTSQPQQKLQSLVTPPLARRKEDGGKQFLSPPRGAGTGPSRPQNALTMRPGDAPRAALTARVDKERAPIDAKKAPPTTSTLATAAAPPPWLPLVQSASWLLQCAGPHEQRPTADRPAPRLSTDAAAACLADLLSTAFEARTLLQHQHQLSPDTSRNPPDDETPLSADGKACAAPLAAFGVGPQMHPSRTSQTLTAAAVAAATAMAAEASAVSGSPRTALGSTQRQTPHAPPCTTRACRGAVQVLRGMRALLAAFEAAAGQSDAAVAAAAAEWHQSQQPPTRESAGSAQGTPAQAPQPPPEQPWVLQLVPPLTSAPSSPLTARAFQRRGSTASISALSSTQGSRGSPRDGDEIRQTLRDLEGTTNTLKTNVAGTGALPALAAADVLTCPLGLWLLRPDVRWALRAIRRLISPPAAPLPPDHAPHAALSLPLGLFYEACIL